MNKIKYLFLLMPLFSRGQTDSTLGYVQPWLSNRSQIVWMNTMAMDIRNVEFDTLQFAVLLKMPLDSGYFLMRQGVRFDPVMLLRCNAVKRRSVSGLGQAWEMLDPLGRPIDYLLVRGYQTVLITQTGQK